MATDTAAVKAEAAGPEAKAEAQAQAPAEAEAQCAEGAKGPAIVNQIKKVLLAGVGAVRRQLLG